METNCELIEQLGDALDEATVCGMSCDQERAECRLLLDVPSLPERQSYDPDPRRVLILTGVTRSEVVLRLDDADTFANPALPLADQQELDRFFARIEWGESMYGWRFIDDDEDPKNRWPAEPSLRVMLAERPATHSLYWFSECEVGDGDEFVTRYLLEGVIEFESAAAERADGTPMSLRLLIDDANRWWQAFLTGEPRMSVEMQREASQNTVSWRRRTRQTVYVPG